MKKKLCHIISFILVVSSFTLLTNVFGQGFELGNTSTILNTDMNDAINTDNGGGTIGDPIREGAYQIINSNDGDYEVGGIINDEITDHDTALNNTLGIIIRIINYALGMLSLVALIYLLLHGFMMVTAAGDDAKYKKGLKGIKYAAIALAGIGLSRFIISFIFWIIENIATSV
ncbi:MAG TPA: hypothetical protein VJ892_01445 [Candidatus Absconditabacterales bacterium]|nr:hypothetical protein [Candidatus Absconditabacterales bacterium]